MRLRKGLQNEESMDGSSKVCSCKILCNCVKMYLVTVSKTLVKRLRVKDLRSWSASKDKSRIMTWCYVHICHLRANSSVWLSHTSSIWPWWGVPKVHLYSTFISSLCQAFNINNGTPTGIGIIHWFSTSMGTIDCRYWCLKMMPLPALEILHFGSALV